MALQHVKQLALVGVCARLIATAGYLTTSILRRDTLGLRLFLWLCVFSDFTVTAIGSFRGTDL